MTSAIGTPAACSACEELLGARLPRDPGGDPLGHPAVEEVDDLLERQVDAALLRALAADTSIGLPTSDSPSSCVQTPPCASTSSVSAAIQ